MRQDQKRRQRNLARAKNLKKLLKQARTSHTPKNLRAAFSALDKAVKIHLVHKNKAARLKSQLAKLIKRKEEIKKVVKKPPKKATQKPRKKPQALLS